MREGDMIRVGGGEGGNCSVRSRWGIFGIGRRGCFWFLLILWVLL